MAENCNDLVVLEDRVRLNQRQFLRGFVYPDLDLSSSAAILGYLLTLKDLRLISSSRRCDVSYKWSDSKDDLSSLQNPEIYLIPVVYTHLNPEEVQELILLNHELVEKLGEDRFFIKFEDNIMLYRVYKDKSFTLTKVDSTPNFLKTLNPGSLKKLEKVLG